MKKTKLEPELLIDSHHGIYIPQFFAQQYGLPDNFKNWDEIKEDIEFLQADNSPDKEGYWDAWDSVSGNARLWANNHEYYLYQSCDLWSVPKGYKNADFFE